MNKKYYIQLQGEQKQMINEQQGYKNFENEEYYLIKQNHYDELDDINFHYNSLTVPQNINNQANQSIKHKLRIKKDRYGLIRINKIRRTQEPQYLIQNQNKITLDFQSDYIDQNQGINQYRSQISEEDLFSRSSNLNIQQNKIKSQKEKDKDNYLPQIEQKRLFDTQMTRRQKVERYLNKKQHRVFEKKISYHCRKIVADSRLRYKGRFITRQIAEQMLQRDLSKLSNSQIKVLLEKLQY